MNRPPPLDRAQTEALLTFLLNPEQRDLRDTVIGTLPASALTKEYQVYFARRTNVGLGIMRKGARDVRAADILGALDRLNERESAFVRHLLRFWLFIHADVIKALTAGKALPTYVTDETLNLVTRVLNDDAALSSALRASVTAAHQALQDSADRLSALEQEVKELRAEQATSAQAWDRERRAWTAQQARDMEVREAERSAVQAEWQARLAQQDTEARRAVAHQENARAADRAAYDLALNELREAQQATVAGLQRRIADVRQEEQARHQAERQRTEQLEEQLRHAFHRAPELPGRLPDALEGAIVINYFALHDDDPVGRLTGLLRLYRALLDHNLDDEDLRRASNASAENITSPRGVVVVGLEQCLADATNLGVDRMLNLASIQRDSLLRQLVLRMDSPRLEGLV